MKKLTPIQAAFLYWVIFNFGETGWKSHEPIINEAKAILGNSNYPSEVVYDNEGAPMIDWTQFGGESPDHYNPANWLWENEEEGEEKPQYKAPFDFLFEFPTPENLGFIITQIKES